MPRTKWRCIKKNTTNGKIIEMNVVAVNNSQPCPYWLTKFLTVGIHKVKGSNPFSSTKRRPRQRRGFRLVAWFLAYFLR